jgi:hypothetical protein
MAVGLKEWRCALNVVQCTRSEAATRHDSRRRSGANGSLPIVRERCAAKVSEIQEIRQIWSALDSIRYDAHSGAQITIPHGNNPRPARHNVALQSPTYTLT